MNELALVVVVAVDCWLLAIYMRHIQTDVTLQTISQCPTMR